MLIASSYDKLIVDGVQAYIKLLPVDTFHPLRLLNLRYFVLLPGIYSGMRVCNTNRPSAGRTR